MISRRRLLHLAGTSAVAGGLGFGLAGCGSSSDTGQESGKLRFAWWGNETRHQLTEQAVGLFEKANPGITISGEPGDWTGYYDKLATTVASGDAPDIQQQCDPYLTEYAGRGALADLKQFPDLDLSKFDETILAASTIDGAVYGVPTGLTALALWVNPAVLKKYDEPLPDDATWSWEDYAVIAERIARKSDGAVIGGGQPALDENAFIVFARQQGLQQYTPDGGIGFDRDLLLQFWDWAIDLQDRKAAISVQQATETQAQSIEQSALPTGKMAFSIGWANQITQAEAGGADLKLLRLPGESTSPSKGTFVKPSQHFSISARSKNQENAARLIDFMVNTTEVGKIVLTDRGIPGNTEVLKAVSPDFSSGDAKAADYISLLQTQNLQPQPVPPTGASEFGAMINRYSQAVLFEQQSPDEAADAFLSEITSAIA